MSLLSLRKAIASASAAVLLWSSVVVPGLGSFVANAQSTGSDHYAYEHCQLLEDEGVVKSGTCSKLNDNISKGEFAKIILYVAAIGEDPDATSAATDITDDFVRDAVNTAYNEGILTGEGGDATKSGAGNQLNRAVAATIGGRAYTVVDEFPADGSLSDLVDGQWYSEYARKAVSAGVVVGKVKNGVRTFAAADTLTYGEAMALAFQFARAEIAYDEWTSAGNSGVPSTSAITALDALDVYNFDVTYNFTSGGGSTPTDPTTPTDPSIPVGSESLNMTTVDTSSNLNIPQGANNVLFAAFDVSGNANISQIEILREGPGDEIDINNVYIYYGDQLLANANNQLAFAGEGIQMAAMTSPYRVERRTTGKSINSEDQTVVFFVNISVRGNGRLEVRGDMSLTAAASSQHAFRVTKVTTTNQTYEYPTTTTQYRGASITISGSTVGSINIRTNASVNDVYVGQKDAVITRFEAQLNSLEGAKLERLSIQFRGGVSATDMSNYKLYITGVAEPLATTPVAGFNDLVTFIVCATKVDGICQPFAINKGDTRVFYVTANLDGAQTGETIQANFDETTDLVFIGTTLGAGLNIILNNFLTTTTVLGADLAISFVGPPAGQTSAGLNSAVLAKWNLTNNSGGRLQARDWQVNVFSTVTGNLTTNVITNARLVILDKDGREVASLFSSVDLNGTTTRVSAPVAAVVSGLAGFQVTISFQGSYDIQAGSDIDVAFVANLEAGVATSQILITLVDLSQNGRIRDDNNDNLTANEIKPASNIAAAVQAILATAIQLSSSPLLGNPALALGERSVDLMAVNFRAGSGTDVNFSQIQYSITAGPNAQHGLSLAQAAQATFLNIRLEVNDGGTRKVVSDIETIDVNGKLLFDNLENKFTVVNGTSVDLILVADINTSGKETNRNAAGALVANVAYQFQIDSGVGSATNKDGRNIATANLFPAGAVAGQAVAGQLVTVSTGGTILLSDQSQTRTQYVAQTTSNSVTIVALIFKVESENATSQLDDLNVAVVTGIPSQDQLIVTAVPAATGAAANVDSLFITEGNGIPPAASTVGGNINGVAAPNNIVAFTCRVDFVNAGGNVPGCNGNGTAVSTIDVTVATTPALVAAQLRLITLNGRVTPTGSGVGVIYTKNEPLTDNNTLFTAQGVVTTPGQFNATILTAGRRDGRAQATITDPAGGGNSTVANNQTLVITDNLNAAAIAAAVAPAVVPRICTITFVTGPTTDLTDCSGNGATISLNLAGPTPRTGNQLMAAVANVIAIAGYDVSDNGAGVLTITGDYPLIGATLAVTGSSAVTALSGGAGPGPLVFANLVPGTATIPNTASGMLATAEYYADGVMVKPASTISIDSILFRDLDLDHPNDVPISEAIYVKPKQVITGGATAGQYFRLVLQRNVFRTVNAGSFLSKSGQELNPLTVALNNGNQFVIQQATISFESGGAIDSDLLSSSRLQFLKFKLPKSGTGTVEIGNGVANSLIQFEINKTGTVGVTSCEIQDNKNTVIATSSAFTLDPFATAPTTPNLVGDSSAFVSFTPASFTAGKRIEGGSTVYTVFCTIGGPGSAVATTNSVQVSLTQNIRLGIVDNDVAIMNRTDKFLGLPITGTPRIAP